MVYRSATPAGAGAGTGTVTVTPARQHFIHGGGSGSRPGDSIMHIPSTSLGSQQVAATFLIDMQLADANLLLECLTRQLTTSMTSFRHRGPDGTVANAVWRGWE